MNEAPTQGMRSLPALLRAAERRVNAHCFTGDKQTFASIPADRDRDLDLLLAEAADEIERLGSLFHDACKSMESCACDWAVDPQTGEPTGPHHGIAALCDAHRDYFRELEAAEIKRLREFIGACQGRSANGFSNVEQLRAFSLEAPHE